MVKMVCNHRAQIITFPAEITSLKEKVLVLPEFNYTEVVNRIQALINQWD